MKGLSGICALQFLLLTAVPNGAAANEAEKKATVAWLKRLNAEQGSYYVTRADGDLVSVATLHQVYSITFGKPASGKFDVRQLRHLRHLPGLQDLTFESSAFGDEIVPYLAVLKDVWRIDFVSTRMTAKGFDALSRLPNLQDTFAGTKIEATPVDPEVFCYLARFPLMKEIFFLRSSAAPITEKVVKCIGQMRRLDLLNITRAKVTADAFRHIGVLPRLASLDIESSPGIGPGAIRAFARLPALRSLRLLSSDASGGFEALAQAPNLRSLHLGHTRWRQPRAGQAPPPRAPFNDDDGAAVGSLKELRFLRLDYTQITDRTLAALTKLQHLTGLSLAFARITDAGVGQVAKIRTIRQLSLKGSPIGDAAVKALVQLPNLQRLILSHTKITDAAVPYLAKMPALKAVAIDKTAVTKQGHAKLCDAAAGRFRIRADEFC